MNLFKVFLIFVAFFCLKFSATAQDMSDYGSPLEIIIPYDTDSLYAVYNETKSPDDLDIVTQWSSIKYFSPSTPEWSPDGQWIAFATEGHLWIVSVDGGIPELIYSNYKNIEYYGRRYDQINNICFTPDSKEITFSKDYLDEEKGSIIDITINDDGSTQSSLNNPVYSIESVNIYTGEHRVIADGKQPSWSHDGRYLCYINFDYRRQTSGTPDHDTYLTVLDTQTGEKRFLTYGFAIKTPLFSTDDSEIMYSFNPGLGSTQFYKILASGGDIEQFSFPIQYWDGTGKQRYLSDISPDGEWILYEDSNIDRIYSYSFSDSTGTRWKGSCPTKHLCLYHLVSGETYKIFPEPQDTNMEGGNGVFSPEGTKICYLFRDYSHRDTVNPHLYIRDIDLDSYLDVHVEAESPESYMLLSNYPNPFNPATTISYNLPRNGLVSMKVYNTSGQVVCVLKNEYQSAGNYSLTWNANELSSGIYFCVLTANELSETRKMMLVR